MASKPPAKKPKLYFGHYQTEWETEKELQKLITSSEEGKEYAYCKV